MALFCLIAVPFVSMPPMGMERHVATNGTSQGTGTVQNPYAAISTGIAALRAGDTLTVHAGTYAITSPIFVRNLSASSATPILIRAEGPVTITNGENAVGTWQGAIDIRDCAWITVKKFSIQKSGFFGIYMERVDHVTIEQCTTRATMASGIASWNNTNVTISGNDISAACDQGQAGDPNSSCQECISLDHTNGFTVENNRVHDAAQNGKANWGGGEGIDIKNGSSNGIVRYNHVYNIVQLGLYVEAWEADIRNVEVYGNLLHNNANGIVVTSEQTGNLSNVFVHDNVVYDCGLSGFSFGHYKDGITVDSLWVFNNTFVHNGYAENQPYFMPDKGNWFSGIATERADITHVVIRDNIVFDNAADQISLPAGLGSLLCTHNLLGKSGGAVTGVRGDSAIIGNPSFVRYGANGDRDLHLTASSPAVNAGKGGAFAASADFDKNARIVNGRIDIGAYEFQSTSLALFPPPSHNAIPREFRNAYYYRVDGRLISSNIDAPHPGAGVIIEFSGYRVRSIVVRY